MDRSTPSNGAPIGGHVVRAAIVAAAYAAVTIVDRQLIIPAVFIAPVRLAMGLATATLVLSPRSQWWLYVLALLPGHLVLRNPANGYTVALLYFTAHGLGAVAAAFIFQRLAGGRLRLDNLRSCLGFLGSAVLTGPLIAASIGTPSVAHRDLTVSAWSTWEVWALAEAVGMLVVIPLLLALPAAVRAGRGGRLRLGAGRAAEGLLVMGGIVLAAMPAFRGPTSALSSTYFASLYLPFPFLVWAAIRFGPEGAAVANLELAMVIITSVLGARGPFGQPWNADTVLAIQQFLVVTCATSVTLAGLIASRQTAQEALRESESRYRELFENAQDVIVVTSPQGEILDANKALTTLTGWAPEKWIGRSIFDLIEPGEVADARLALRERLSGRLPGRRRWRFVGQDGKPRIIDARTTVFERDGVPTSVMSVARDVTDEEREAEEKALRDASLQHTRKIQALGQLAGGIAHDFNNLLQAISGYAELAADAAGPNHAAAEPLKNVAHLTERAAALTRQLLVFSRREGLKTEPLDLGVVVKDFARVLRRVIGEHIQVTVRTADHAARILADRNRIEQIVMNLCINARDAMPQGGPLAIETGSAAFSEEEADALPWARPGRWVYLRVADHGSGISDEARPHIFEPFFTTKRQGQGSGLGLATVHAIVEQHGGLIDVETTVGQGTTFTVYLPESADTGEPATADAPVHAAPRGKSESILVAEDEQFVRELAVEILEAAGYRVVVAADGQQAEALVAEHGSSLSLALLDVVMPYRSGRDVYETIRRQWPSLPVLFSSGYSFGELSDLPPLASADVLLKPYNRTALLDKVRALIDAPGGAQRGRV